jgi:hypothetical protein
MFYGSTEEKSFPPATMLDSWYKQFVFVVTWLCIIGTLFAIKLFPVSLVRGGPPFHPVLLQAVSSYHTSSFLSLSTSGVSTIVKPILSYSQ